MRKKGYKRKTKKKGSIRDLIVRQPREKGTHKRAPYAKQKTRLTESRSTDTSDVINYLAVQLTGVQLTEGPTPQTGFVPPKSPGASTSSNRRMHGA